MELTRRIDSLHISSGLPKACGDQRWRKRRKSLVLSPNRPHGPQSPNTAPQNWHGGLWTLQEMWNCKVLLVVLHQMYFHWHNPFLHEYWIIKIGGANHPWVLSDWETDKRLWSRSCAAHGDFVEQEGRRVTGVRGNDTHSVTKVWSSSVANCWRQQPKCTHDRLSIWLFWWPGSPALRAIFWRQISTRRLT